MEIHTLDGRRDVSGSRAVEGHPVLLLGGGSNLLVADTGFDGLVLRPTMYHREVTVVGDDVLVAAGAGEDWDALVGEAALEGWAGVECLAGIPGTVGAATSNRSSGDLEPESTTVTLPATTGLKSDIRVRCAANAESCPTTSGGNSTNSSDSAVQCVMETAPSP